MTVVLMAVGCATHPTPLPENAPPAAVDCAAMFAKLDEAIDAHGVRDAQEFRLPGFPYLRVNRFVASFAGEARTDDAAREAMLTGMATLDVHARQFESANLPGDVRATLGALPLESCSATMLQYGRATPSRVAAILEQARVPDAYADWKRALGLYAITSIPFRWGVALWEESTRRKFETASAAPLTRWLPPPAEAALLRRHAPVFEIDARTAVDQFGAPQWTNDGIVVDTRKPGVFTHIAHTRFEGQTLAQLIYTLWFPSRPCAGPFDPLCGHLDALTVRLTLDHDDEVLMADSIHACGCYHQFFPSSRLVPRPPPDGREEWAFSPASLPVIQKGQRLVFRIASGSHDLFGIGAMNVDAAEGTRYAMQPANTLRSLPLPGNAGRRSLYGADGLVAGTGRGERFLFWPMGIASPGAMRQWGHHATAFVGKRHFDDADLIEKRFARAAQELAVKVQ
ncbi:MAG: hypothetical protein JNJ55_02005 [Betaproteobacteria bacterium]|nr:hypothetical protein [Betaproteobacteria bacterium]